MSYYVPCLQCIVKSIRFKQRIPVSSRPKKKIDFWNKHQNHQDSYRTDRINFMFLHFFLCALKIWMNSYVLKFHAEWVFWLSCSNVCRYVQGFYSFSMSLTLHFHCKQHIIFLCSNLKNGNSHIESVIYTKTYSEVIAQNFLFFNIWLGYPYQNLIF